MINSCCAWGSPVWSRLVHFKISMVFALRNNIRIVLIKEKWWLDMPTKVDERNQKSSRKGIVIFYWTLHVLWGKDMLKQYEWYVLLSVFTHMNLRENLFLKWAFSDHISKSLQTHRHCAKFLCVLPHSILIIIFPIYGLINQDQREHYYCFNLGGEEIIYISSHSLYTAELEN